MIDKNSLAFILTTHASTPRGVPCHHDHHESAGSYYPTRRLHSGRHRVAQAFFPTDSLRHSLARPLTTHLGQASDAPRIDRVRLRQLSSDHRTAARPSMPTRKADPVESPHNGFLNPSPPIREPTRADSSDPIRKSSKFCMVDGCTSRAKHARRCWKHGGSVKCKVPDCANRAKSKGVCWSHGGGSPCSVEDCDTIAVSNGFCWAHGGGKRCRERGCSRPAYERTRNYCAQHYEDLERAAATLC